MKKKKKTTNTQGNKSLFTSNTNRKKNNTDLTDICNLVCSLTQRSLAYRNTAKQTFHSRQKYRKAGIITEIQKSRSYSTGLMPVTARYQLQPETKISLLTLMVSCLLSSPVPVTTSLVETFLLVLRFKLFTLAVLHLNKP